MPRIAKKDMAPLPKPVIKAGTLGYFPLNTLSLSGVAQGHGAAILGYGDDPRNASYKEHPNLKIKAGKKPSHKTVEFSLVGVFFTGLADALYRGKLPEVIIATPEPRELGLFLNEFLGYVEKMITLGFVLHKSNPVAELVPCFVIATPGVFFSQFLAQLSRNLQNLPDVDDALRSKIIGRFCRAVPDCELNFEPVGKQVELCEIPRRIKIAGGDTKTQQTVQEVLSANQIITVIENSVKNSAERLEFESALSRLGNVVLPLLKNEKALTAKELKELQTRLADVIFEIGRKRNAFEEFDNAGTLGKSVKPVAVESLSATDAATLGGLRLYAEALNLNTETRAMLDALSEKITQRLSK